ncbi:Multidrug resistance protein [Oleoguttula sp. CCFEE 5521]
MVNEYSNREFRCSSLVAPYESLDTRSQVCAAVGSVPGQDFDSGDAYINSAFSHYHSHKWRNPGIILGIMSILLGVYIPATEFITAKKSKGEVLVFRRGHTPASFSEKTSDVGSADTGNNGAALEKQRSHVGASDLTLRQTAFFSLRDVVATLLDALGARVSIGVIDGEILVDGRQRDSSFQRKTGHVQQEDLHHSTTTIREALNFSTLLRQPASVSRHNKLAYIDEVIKLLDMEEYADAVVGVPSAGLDVEQRKRLTNGVELAAKPELLLFLDEPTSGHDSGTLWAIYDLMQKLKNSGQAILCTIHQPSAMLFQRFDRLHFPAKGGKTVYFGEVRDDA